MTSDDHKHLRKREPKSKPAKRCPIPGCDWIGRNQTEHLATAHHVPLVRLGQGEWERRIG